jgi:hypothetical protein
MSFFVVYSFFYAVVEVGIWALLGRIVQPVLKPDVAQTLQWTNRLCCISLFSFLLDKSLGQCHTQRGLIISEKNGCEWGCV